jgi:DNA repair protein RadD
MPSWKCVMMLRPTASLALMIQQAGRGLRTWEGIQALVLDHAGNVMRHGLPHDDRDWPLAIDAAGGNPKIGGGSGGSGGKFGKTRIRECPSCHLIGAESLPACEGCGAAFRASECVPEELDARLLEVAFSRETKAEELSRLRAFAAARGFGDKWAGKVYEAKFGERAAA